MEELIMSKRYGFFFRKTIVQEDSDFVNNIIEIELSPSDVTQEKINEALESYAKPVINNTAYGSHAKDAFLNKATGLVSLTTTINTPTFNMNKLTGLSNNLMSKLKSVTEIGSSSDAFNLISNIRNAEYNMTRIYFSM